MPANRPPDRAPYGSHLPSGIKKLADMAAASKQFDRTSSKQNMLNYADPHWKGPKGPDTDTGPADGSHLQQQFTQKAKKAAAPQQPPHDPNNPDGPLGGQPAKKPKGPKKPKDPNLNPGMTVPFGRR